MTTSQRKRTPQPGHRVTSLTLTLPMWQALKIRAVREGRSLRAVLVTAVERYLETDIGPVPPVAGVDE